MAKQVLTEKRKAYLREYRQRPEVKAQQRAYQREHYQQPEIKAARAAWFAAHKEEKRAYDKKRIAENLAILERQYAVRHSRPERRMIESAKRRAKRYGVPFGIVEGDVRIPLSCPALGVELRRNLGARQQGTDSPVVDRIHPARGYVPTNIIVVCSRANLMKGNRAPADIKNGKVRAFYVLLEQNLRFAHVGYKLPAGF